MKDFDAWEPEEPPADFAERVVRAARSELPSDRRRGLWVLGGAAFAAAAAAALVVARGAPSHGEIRADSRQEAHLGSRAVAVLEHGAHLTWTADEVTQDRGDVFYRVEPKGAFLVHTPAGDVSVLGTCFRVKVRGADEMNNRDVKSGAVGAALSAMAFVAVYEGKVVVSHASEHVDLAAGEAADVSRAGVGRVQDLASAERGFDAKAAADDEPFARANQNLADSVREYKDRLNKLDAEKSELQKELHDAQEKIAATHSDGSAALAKNAYDLSTDDWRELAKDGTVKYRIPCERGARWTPPPSMLDALGLAPQDGPPLRDAMLKSNRRLWSQIKPICAEAAGSPELAEKLGLNTCTHLVLDLARSKDDEGTAEAMRRVGEIRAGIRPMPGANDSVSPVERMFLVFTGEQASFQGDLAQTFGPEEAHRIAFSEGEGLCASSNSFGGPGPRKK
jgi:hypothetical protein